MKIDFDTIIYNEHSHLDGYSVYNERQIEAIKACMREACKIALDEAAERATARVFMPSHPHLHDTENAVVDKQSILKIKEEL